jgi:hypothetical protein
MEVLEKYFLAQAAKGIVLTGQELRAYGQRQKLKDIPSLVLLRQMRLRNANTATFASYKKPEALMAPSYYRYGAIFIDYFIYQDSAKYRWHNGGCGGFILAAEAVSHQLAAVPVKSKSTASWEMATKQFIEVFFDGVVVIQSDREAALTSVKFAEKLKRDFGVEIVHLKQRQKAHLAERYGRYVKERLSVACSFNKKNNLNWTRHLISVIKEFNGRIITGTSFRRSSIDKTNFLDLLRQLHKIEDPDVLMNLSTSSNHSDRVKKKLWKYKVNDRVVLLRSANYQVGQKSSGVFTKFSTEGRFSTRQYVITRLILKRDKALSLIPAYELSYGGKKLSGMYYEREVKKVSFAE